MAISDLLTQLNKTKQAIKQAISNKGVNMSNVPFTEYASKIEEIYSIPTKTQTVTQSVSTGWSSNGSNTINFDQLILISGFTSLSLSGSGAGVLSVRTPSGSGITTVNGDGVNAAHSSNCTMTAYQGNLSEDRVETKSFTVGGHGTTNKLTFSNNIKCIKSLSGLSRSYSQCYGISISGNTLTMTMSDYRESPTSNSQTVTIAIYY